MGSAAEDEKKPEQHLRQNDQKELLLSFSWSRADFFRYFVFVLFLKWSTDEQYGRSQNVGRQSHESGKKRDAEGCFFSFRIFFRALEVRFMYSRGGGEENSGLDAKKSKRVEEKVSAASDGEIAPEESDSWIGAKR